MEELTVDDILIGLYNSDFQEHHNTLLQILANKCIEEAEDTSVLIPKVIKFCLSQLQSFIPATSLIATDSTHTTSTTTFPITGNEEKVDLFLLILSNISTSEENGATLWTILTEERFPIERLLEVFLAYEPQSEQLLQEVIANESIVWAQIDPFQYTSFILCNLSRSEEGRRLLLRQSSGYIPKLVNQLKSRNLSRRKGTVGCLRNCLFDQDVHWWMIHEVKVLTPILMPLVVGTPFTEREKEGMDPLLWIQAEDADRRPDADIDVVKMLLECIVLLCQTRAVRKILRAKKVYPICRNIDYLLENDQVNDVVYEIVNFLERDDDPYEEQMEREASATSAVSGITQSDETQNLEQTA